MIVSDSSDPSTGSNFLQIDWLSCCQQVFVQKLQAKNYRKISRKRYGALFSEVLVLNARSCRHHWGSGDCYCYGYVDQEAYWTSV